eukprot:jgi/Psemu1/52930/gm1.52930_g
MLSALPITVTFRWVQGHQEGLSLDCWWALCNHQVDGMAKAFLSLNPALHILISGPLLHYWHTHHDISIPLQVSNSIHWCAHHSAFKRLPPGMQWWFVKFVLGCICVGTQLLHYQHQDHSRCPLCAQDEEKVSHVLSCEDPGAVKHSLSSFQGPLQQCLTSELTDPSLALAIVDITTRVRQGRRIHPSSYSPAIASAVRSQRHIGWHNWFLGRWSPLWHQIQADYYSLIGSKR